MRQDWSPAEDEVLLKAYARGGLQAAKAVLPGRTGPSIYHRVSRQKGAVICLPWSKRDDARLRLLWGGDGGSLKVIARKLGRTVRATYQRAQALGLPLGCPQGHEYLSHAAERTGYALSQLRAILEWAGVTIRPALSRPTRKPQRAHTVDSYDVDVAIERWQQGEPVETAARRLGACSGETLKRYLRRLGIRPPGGRRHLRVTDDQIQAALALRIPPDVEELPPVLPSFALGNAIQWATA